MPAQPLPLPEDDDAPGGSSTPGGRSDAELEAERARMVSDQARFELVRQQAAAQSTEREAAEEITEATEEMAGPAEEAAEEEEEQGATEQGATQEQQQQDTSEGREFETDGGTAYTAMEGKRRQPEPEDGVSTEDAKAEEESEGSRSAQGGEAGGAVEQSSKEASKDDQPEGVAAQGEREPTIGSSSGGGAAASDAEHRPGHPQAEASHQGGIDATKRGEPGADDATKQRAERIGGGGATAGAAGGAEGAGGLDKAFSGGGDGVAKKLVNKEMMDKLGRELELTPQQQKAVQNAAEIAQAVVAGGELAEGAVTPSNIKNTWKGIKAAKDMVKGEGGIKDLMEAAPQAAKGLQKWAAEKAKEYVWSLVKTAFLLILLIVLLGFLVFYIVVMITITNKTSLLRRTAMGFLTGGVTGAVVQGTSGVIEDSLRGSRFLPATAEIPLTSGFLQNQPGQLLGLSNDLLLVLNRCGDRAPTVVVMGAGGPPGTARYEGRSVGLSTQGMNRGVLRDLTVCLQREAEPCVEELLSPDDIVCVSPATTPSCEAQRLAQEKSTGGELLFSLKRSCSPTANAPPSGTP